VSRLTRYAQRSTQHVTLRVFLLALLAYGLSAQVWAHAVSLAPHYVYLAYSLLRGHADLLHPPPVIYDLLNFNGQWFVAGSPLPAILMLPFVAIFGTGFSDVLFSVVLGAIDVALVYALLGIFLERPERSSARAAESQDAARPAARFAAHSSIPASGGPAYAQSAGSLTITESTRRWITLLFALGTPFWYLASLGTYWFTAHLVVVLFALLATREALTRQRWFLVGLYLACAGFARPTALFLTPFFLIVMFDAARSAQPAAHGAYPIVRNSVLFGAALALGIGAHFAYNYARFRSFTDFGYAYVSGADNITSVYARYGGFNLRFAPCNLTVSLLAPPQVNGAVPAFVTQSCAYLLEGVNLSDTSALVTPNPLGMSVFVVTPALLLIFTAFKRRPLILASWAGLLTILIPLWLYHNTGSLQFGWRYLFDAAPMWIILLAAGMQKMTRPKQGLILVSIAINAWGFLWMFEKLNGTSWWSF
jgi:hypothetical protein